MFMLTPPNGALAGRSISNSLRFNIADSASLTRTFAAGNRKTWTWSAWVKRASLGAIQSLFCSAQTSYNTDTVHFLAYFNSDDTLAVGGAVTAWRATTQVFRDPAAHYHIVVAVDTTQATAGDRIKLYVNGVQITAFSTTNNPAQGADLGVNIAQPHSMGARTQLSPTYYFGGYMSDIQFVDGQALTPASFGVADRVTGQWVPKKYTGTYGTNGFYLPFNDGTSTTTLGYDRSGNANNWTLNNFSVAAGAGNDWLADTPTNNYCVIGQLARLTTSPTISDGALRASGSDAQAVGSVAVTSGKWYAECTYATAKAGDNIVGVQSVRAFESVSSVAALRNSSSVGYDSLGGSSSKVVNNSFSSYGSSWTTGDVIGVALDIDNGEVTFFKNGVSQGAISYAFAGAGPWVFANGVGSTPATITFDWNFGQQAFAYAPPTGYKALCTKNLPAPAVKNSAKHFDVKTYTGNGSTNSVAGVAFQPDLVWGKARSIIQSHGLYDSARGATKALYSDLTNAESTDSNALTSFNTDGFSMGSSANVNQNGAAYVAWVWKESTVAGFDIVAYTGDGTADRAVPHSLGVAPKMYITKSRSGTGDWVCRHTLVDGSLDYVSMNLANANANAGESTPSPTSFYVANGADNTNGAAYVAYCFTEVPGYSKLGRYTGNGSADGPFVYCGFKPKYVLVKRADAAAAWYVTDGARDVVNEVRTYLYPNLSNLDSVGSAGSYREDFLSNGFKLRGAGADINAASGTYIFVAFAEAPFKYSCAR